ncbi:hypothetical protein DV452_000897 [Geotrichum candidum]|nr:hypothetical protein DV452_000897 [Geotrichum candidum]KAI9214904.1 hypothetical protein DS838_000235 [Geotrichum bryndzae]
MNIDSTLKNLLWNGSISVRLVLSQDEARNFVDYDYYINVPRLSYLHLQLPSALQFFRPLLRHPEDADMLDWWLEFEGVPIKWNWPIGLSFDLLTNHDPNKGPDAYAEIVPWTLILHKKNYPKDRILSLDDGIETVRSYWLNQIKEVSTLMPF